MKLGKILLGLAGVLFVVITLVAWFGIPLDHSPTTSSSGSYTLAYYAAHHNAELASFYVQGVALGVLIVYAAMLWRTLRSVTGQQVLPATIFGGAIAAVGGMVASGSATLALIEGPRAGMSAATASALNAFDNTDPIGLQLGAAVMAIAAGTAIVTSQRGRWMRVLGACSLVTGVLQAVNPAFLVVFMVWVVAIGFIAGAAAGRRGAVPQRSPEPAAGWVPEPHSSMTS